ncbi:MAG: NAD(P)-dependent oxidoreductase [Pseudomonadota bacterium]
MTPPAPDAAAPRTTLRTGLIGPGLMGRGMGLSLLRAGHSLGVVAHRRRETVDELVSAGAWEAPDAASLATLCDVLVLCLPSVEAAESVLFGSGGITQGALHRSRQDLLVIECSTLTPAAAVSFDGRLGQAGIAFADAPVTRGPREAVAGTLNALLGGRPGHAGRASQVLGAFCEKIFTFGAPGQGYAAKLVSNFLAFSNLAAVAEGMATATRAGLDMPVLMQALALGGAQSRVLDGLAPVLAGTGESRSIVTVGTAHKDVAYYLAFARAAGSAGAVAECVEGQYAEAVSAGLGGELTPQYLRHRSRP